MTISSMKNGDNMTDELKQPDAKPDQVIGTIIQKPNGTIEIKFDQQKKIQLADGKIKLPDGKQILNESAL